MSRKALFICDECGADEIIEPHTPAAPAPPQGWAYLRHQGRYAWAIVLCQTCLSRIPALENKVIEATTRRESDLAKETVA